MKKIRRTATAKQRSSVHARHTQLRHTLKAHIRRNRPMHRRFLLHPASIMLLLAAGVLISGWTFHAAAVSYTVTGKIPAAPLTEGAIITSPADGTIFTASPIDVSGTCPDNSYVNLTRNGIFSGSAMCVSNAFTITTSLTEGANTLEAQDYNVTNDPGPATPTITVTYAPPTPPSPPPATGNSAGPSGTSSGRSGETPLLIATDYHFQAFSTDMAFTWDLDLQGGIAPYQIHTDWGDGQVSDQTALTSGTFTISHQYEKPGYYPVKVAATDARRQTILIQLVAFIRQASTVGGSLPVTGTAIISPLQSIWNAATGGQNRWLWLAWPTYITVVLMAVSFWLGERQALQRMLLSAKGARARHIPHAGHH